MFLHCVVLSALAVEKTANSSLRTMLDKLVAEEDSEFTCSRQLLDVHMVPHMMTVWPS